MPHFEFLSCAMNVIKSVNRQTTLFRSKFNIIKTIIPKVKRVVTKNKESFKIFYELGDVCEPISPTSLKTCTLYNQGRQCREGNSHCDQRGNNRLHVCTVCWETLWVYAPHGIFACPLLTRKFWADQNIVRLL